MTVTKSQIYLLNVASGKSVEAILYDAIQPNHTHDADTKWKEHFDAVSQSKGVSAKQLKMVEESSHWNWSAKFQATAGQLIYQSFAIECDRVTQGLMITNSDGKACKIEAQKNKPLVYVEYLEVAPWNRPSLGTQRYKWVGKTMIAAAIQTSIDLDFKGRIGLHSLPQADQFYINICGMTDLGQDAAYKGQLRYLEMTSEQAYNFLRRKP